jgi:hypothetical protein
MIKKNAITFYKNAVKITLNAVTFSINAETGQNSFGMNAKNACNSSQAFALHLLNAMDVLKKQLLFKNNNSWSKILFFKNIFLFH